MRLSQSRLFCTLLLCAALIAAPIALASTSVANIRVVGYVPSVFRVTSLGQVTDLDLTPGVVVTNRTIGYLAFMYNENIQTLNISSSTLSGAPEDGGGNAYQFGGSGDFQVAFAAGCDTVDPAYNAPFTLTNVGVDVKSALAGALVNQGIQEDCEMTASYTGTTTALPLAGRFEMRIVVTMIGF